MVCGRGRSGRASSQPSPVGREELELLWGGSFRFLPVPQIPRPKIGHKGSPSPLPVLGPLRPWFVALDELWVGGIIFIREGPC